MSTVAERISPPVNPQSSATFRYPVDLLQRANRRLSVITLCLGVAITAVVAAFVLIAMRPPLVRIVTVMPDGQQYIITNPRLALRQLDSALYEQTRQDLRIMADACF